VFSLMVVITALPANVVDLPVANASKTIVMGYFLQSEPRIAAIGMAVEQALADGLLPGYDFK
jgi:hypothetical protein